MKPSDDLFQLIKSLTKAEKRYFKLTTSLYRSQKNYLRLFDAIALQQQYDEEQLREQFRGERFIGQLNVAKHYLYEQILRSLRACHAKADVKAKLRGLVQNMEILYQKGLRDQAGRMYESALALACEHEEFIFMLQILEWKEKFRPELSATEEGIDELYGPIYEALDRYRNYTDHAVASRKVAVTVVRERPRSQGDLDRLEEMLEYLPKGDDSARSVRAGLLYSWTYATYHFGRGEYQQALSYTRRQIELLEEHSVLIEDDPFDYLSAVNNLLVLLKRLHDVDGLRAAIANVQCKSRAMLEAQHLGGPRLRARLFATIAMNRMTMQLAFGNPDCFKALCVEIEEGLAEHEKYITYPTRLKFYHNLALLYFEIGEYTRALEFNTRIIHGRIPDRFRDSYHDARLMNLVIHYELGNHDLLEHLVVSAGRYFRSRKLLHRFEAAVLEFFRQLVRVKAGKECLLALFQHARLRFAELLADPLEADSFRNFQYLQWIDSRIAQLSFSADESCSGVRREL